jgi:His-Xaa-Ser system protein HxsD
MTDGVPSTPDLHPPDPECSLWIDLRVYSLTALKKAVYAMGAVASGSVELVDQKAKVEFVFVNQNANQREFQARFWRELVDYDLRETIARETEALRNLIVAHALSNVPLVHPELETGTPDTDPRPPESRLAQDE